MIAIWMGAVFPVPGLAGAPERFKLSRLELRAGYGYQYRNDSRPHKFQVIPVLPSAVIPLTDPIGPSWLRGRLEWNPELLLGMFQRPYHRPILGATPVQFRYALQTDSRWTPYLSAGAGILYANINRRESRKDLNFNLQGAAGILWALNDSTALIAEYRHTHLSNAGLHEDNAGINTHTFLVGISRRR